MAQKINLDELLESNKKVYIYNNTKAIVGGSVIKPAGQIHINFPDPSSGKTVSLVIPVTNIPFCLNDYLPVSVIKNSIELRQYIAKGIFKLEEPEAAEKILGTVEAQEEVARLNVSRFSQSNVDFNDDATTVMSEETSEVMSETPNLREDTISLKVKDIMLRLDSNALNVRKALQELKVQSKNLTPADCSYIISNTKEAQLKKFAQQVLAKMQIGEE